MQSAHISVDLQDGWNGSFFCKETMRGSYSGVARITWRGIPKGDLVVMRQPSLEAAVERVRLRGGQFIKARTQP